MILIMIQKILIESAQFVHPEIHKASFAEKKTCRRYPQETKIKKQFDPARPNAVRPNV